MNNKTIHIFTIILLNTFFTFILFYNDFILYNIIIYIINLYKFIYLLNLYKTIFYINNM